MKIPFNVYIWGIGEYGCFGWGDKRNCYEPTLLLDPNTGDKIEWTQIKVGEHHTLGLTKNGQVFSWGQNASGQLGHGDKDERRAPNKVAALDGLVIIKISCGENHTSALTDKGEIFTWGFSWCGGLGHGHGNGWCQLKPKKVEPLADEVIVDVACGWDHTCAVTSTGSILTWGDSSILTGHGTGTLLPRVLQDLSSKGVVSVSANRYHTACVTKAGEVFTWGYGQYGRLGHGDETNQQTPKRVEALIGVKVTMVSCGRLHTVVCTEDGQMYTFGRGEHGQLGHGDEENKSSPALVLALVGKHITQVQCDNDNTTTALTSSGYVFRCGDTEYGVLSHGVLVSHGIIVKPIKCFSFPCLVEGLREHNVVQISGNFHCAAMIDPNPSSIRQSQEASFNNKNHFDVTFMVENESLYANVDTLSQTSDYFAAMFRSNMRESIERVVQVSNCSKEAFLRVLEYLYLDDFTVSMNDVVELWEVADYYQLEGLQYSCMGALERGLSEENVSQILQEAEDLSCPCDELKRMCSEYSTST